MVPIAINKDQKFDYESFENYLIGVCKDHKSTGRALAFAFIVYDFDDYTITDILEKKSYWSSLDKISGKTLSVFYINSKDSYYARRQEQIYQDELEQFNRSIKRGELCRMVPVTRKPTPIDNAIGVIKKEFGLEENIKTPFVLFFQVDNDGNISDSFIVSLKQDKLEDAFLELRAHIKNAVESLGEVLPENYKNHQEIFNLLKIGVQEGIFYDSVKNKIISKLGIGSIISFIEQLVK